MKKIILFLTILLGVLISTNSKAQTYYFKYLYSINDNGMKIKHNQINSYFNVGKNSYITFYNNKSIMCFTKKDGISNNAYFKYGNYIPVCTSTKLPLFLISFLIIYKSF